MQVFLENERKTEGLAGFPGIYLSYRKPSLLFLLCLCIGLLAVMRVKGCFV
jgi:hypothetical protein